MGRWYTLGWKLGLCIGIGVVGAVALNWAFPDWTDRDNALQLWVAQVTVTGAVAVVAIEGIDWLIRRRRRGTAESCRCAVACACLSKSPLEDLSARQRLLRVLKNGAGGIIALGLAAVFLDWAVPSLPWWVAWWVDLLLVGGLFLFTFGEEIGWFIEGRMRAGVNRRRCRCLSACRCPG